jgi:hypothetical protein
VVGVDSSQNKTLPNHQRCERERNEESCEAQSRVVVVPVVVKPVPVQEDLVAVLVEIRDVEVAIMVPHDTYKMPSMPPPFEAISDLRVEFDSAS